MNMYYTGLGIARSLGEHGIPVIGLSASRGVYGNFTRYGTTVLAPDSKDDPQNLLACLLKLGGQMGSGSIIFPTRDADVIFLDRYRDELRPYFVPFIAERGALAACLDKWETYLCARRAGVPTPQCWLIDSDEALRRSLPEIPYPCVLKPVVAYSWRTSANWDQVGRRKAIGISSEAELLTEYARISRADQRALVQEMIPGDDRNLVIAACCLDRQSNWIAGFNTRKLVQIPEGFGTGCIVEAVQRPELFDPALKLLRQIHFTGIAEVEFKWNAARSEYQLIEINPRPWDQHRLGKGCGTDLAWLAYCEYAGIQRPPVASRPSAEKWIAEDGFVAEALLLLWRRDPKLRSLIHLARGKRIYGIWSARDPLPSLAYWTMVLIPRLTAAAFRSAWTAVKSKVSANRLYARKV